MSSKKDQVIIFDTTLRDGEQSPGASMSLNGKIQIAEVLEKMGVDVIEAGFAMASAGDFEAVHEISKLIRNSVICSLARAKDADIEQAGEALKPAARGRIHTFISTSPIHMQHQLNMAEDDVFAAVKSSVSKARQYTDDVEWSCMDASRSDFDFVCKCIEAAIASGATTINIPDTVGYALPSEFGAFFKRIKNNVPNIDKAILSAHCHNDLGLATANALAAIEGGARQIECTINGIGERAGNTALEEVVMAIKTRSDMMQVDAAIKTEMIMKASRLVSSIISFPVQPNKAIVGANAFAHESGIHQDGMLKNASTYEIMTPESVGLTKSELVMGKHSGRHAFKEKLKDLGFDLGDNAFEVAFQQFKDLADKKQNVFDEDIAALISDHLVVSDNSITFKALDLQWCVGKKQSVVVTIEEDGKDQSAEGHGDGPVDAIFTAIRALVPVEASLKSYNVNAVTSGKDAQAGVFVRLEKDGRTTSGHSSDTDTLVASAKAYINALNKLLNQEKIKLTMSVQP